MKHRLATVATIGATAGLALAGPAHAEKKADPNCHGDRVSDVAQGGGFAEAAADAGLTPAEYHAAIKRSCTDSHPYHS